MHRLPDDPRTRTILAAGSVLLSLVVVSGLAAILVSPLGVPDPSPVYLLAVVLIAVVYGTRAAVVTAIGAFLAYDFLFFEPRLTLGVHDPGELLNLFLLLAVGMTVGQLAGLQRSRADAAEAREREARALFGVGRALSTAPSAVEALPRVLEILRDEARMTRVWVRLDEEGGPGRVVADTDGPETPPFPAAHVVLRRTPDDRPATWTRVHDLARARRGEPTAGGEVSYRVRVTAGEGVLGSIWASRAREQGDPSPSETRLMSAAADQVGGAFARDRLAARATDMEVARRSEALKSALLDSVSHDLRTPLATIRAAAGGLMEPPGPIDPAGVRETAAAIDREAERLNRLVSDLLDMSRIEAGDLIPRSRPHVLADLVDQTVERLAGHLAPRRIVNDVPPDLPPVAVDEVFMDQVLTNLLENAARYTPPETLVRVSARVAGDLALVSVEDDGPGVPPEALSHLFDKFYRVPRRREGSRHGSGIGMAVVRGLVEAMSGTITARARSGGGLVVEMSLPLAGVPDDGGESARGSADAA